MAGYGWLNRLLHSADERLRQTLEDPEVDVRKLGLNKDDHVLAITSAGDNVLHYALAAQCERIHAVGMSGRNTILIETTVTGFRYEPMSRPYP